MKKQINADKMMPLGACLLMLIAFYAVSVSGQAAKIQTIQLLMQICELAAVGAAIWTMLTHRETDSGGTVLQMILALGILMRIGYMLYTPADVRGHDLGDISAKGNGHAGYILHLLQGELPPDNGCQFYHPPLFYMLSAIVASGYRLLSGDADPVQLVEAAKTVSCAASIVTLFYARKLCRQLRLSDCATLLAVGLAAFLPNHYLLAGRVNNDSLAVMFMTAILYYTLRWYERQEWGTTVKLALCFGLGMMTKVSVGAFAPVTGALMLLVLYRRIREKSWRPVIGKFAAFGGIAFPLGLWYSVRNWLLFHQPFNYVYQISKDPKLFQISKDTKLYCGDRSLWERFGLVKNLAVYNRPFGDYNVWNYLLKGSLFGEFSFSMGRLIPELLTLINLLLILISLVAMVVVLIRHRTPQWSALICFWLILMASYIVFNLKYPFGCTMDFRYIVPNALIGAVFLAKWWDTLSDKTMRPIKGSVAALTAAFCIVSIVLYSNLAW